MKYNHKQIHVKSILTNDFPVWETASNGVRICSGNGDPHMWCLALYVVVTEDGVRERLDLMSGPRGFIGHAKLRSSPYYLGELAKPGVLTHVRAELLSRFEAFVNAGGVLALISQPAILIEP